MFSAVGLTPRRKSTSKFRCLWSRLADDVLLDRALQVPEVHDVSRLRVDLPVHRHLEHVGVPVPVGIVALVEDAAVPLRVPFLPVQPVRRREVRGRYQPNPHEPDSSLPVPVIPRSRSLSFRGAQRRGICSRLLTGTGSRRLTSRPSPAQMRPPVGTWRSLVAYLNGVQGVPGSNPGVPTNKTLANSNRAKPNPRVFLGFSQISLGRPSEPLCCFLLFYWLRIRTHFRTRAWKAVRRKRVDFPSWRSTGLGHERIAD